MNQAGISPGSSVRNKGKSLPPVFTDHWRLGQVRLGEISAVALFAGAAASVLGASISICIGLEWICGLPIPLQLLIHSAAAAGIICILYGILIEPYRLTTNFLEFRNPKVKSALRLVHLTDLHVREWGELEKKLISRVRELGPDAILLTGDYTAVPGSAAAIERLLRELSIVAPVFASLGNCEHRRPIHLKLRKGGPTWLCNEKMELKSGATVIQIVGVNAGDEEAFWEMGGEIDQRAVAICLYHYPDLVPELARIPYDLMLCGHTHGGQVRLPWIGALISLSRAGVKYARGAFWSGAKVAFVSQGIGCEGYGLPRIRFLCPPEIGVIDLRPSCEAA